MTADERAVNTLHAAIRAPAERGNSLLKTTLKALRQVSVCPGGSARSRQPPSSCSTTSTAAPHDQQASHIVTGNSSLTVAKLRGMLLVPMAPSVVTGGSREWQLE